jgi:PelA/Pel-15E family pectate lyase
MALDPGGSISRRSLFAGAAASGLVAVTSQVQATHPPLDRQTVKAAMLAASRHMVEKISRQGGYVWQTLPDGSRAWGELEAFPTTVWVQTPGTPLMGQVYLDAYHATGEEYFYRAAAMAADVLIRGQHSSGGWNYHFDLTGEDVTRKWYETIGRNAWRLEEFQHYYGNATFDDSCTADCAKFMLRMYLEKREPRFRTALDKVIGFVLDSQYPVGGWPQRFPRRPAWRHNGLPDYTSFITFNDDVAAENIAFLLMVWQTLGDRKVLEGIARGMDCFVHAQQPQPQPAWGLQHTVADLKPASARTYEPRAFASHVTAANVGLMMDFYEMTGNRKFLARLPEAIKWLEEIRLPASVDAKRRCPTFVEVGSGRPLFLHRRGSNASNGVYFSNQDPSHTIAHYGSFRTIDLDRLRSRYERVSSSDAKALAASSPLKGGRRVLPRYFTLSPIGLADLNGRNASKSPRSALIDANRVISELDAQGRWLTPLKTTSNPYVHQGSDASTGADYSQTYVGDQYDTSPYPDPEPPFGISTETFVQNMGVFVRFISDIDRV